MAESISSIGRVSVSTRATASNNPPRPKRGKSINKRKRKPKKAKKHLFGKKDKRDESHQIENSSQDSQHVSGYKTVTQQRIADEVNKKHGSQLSQLNRTTLMREKLHGISNMIGDDELDKLVKMDTTLDQIKRRMKNRVVIAIAMIAFGLFLMALMTILHRGKFGFIFAAAGVALGALTWFMDIRKTNNYYRQFRLERQIAFSQFVRLAAAYLPELSQGANLYSVFKKILPRMDNKRDHASLETLMIDMQVDPDDPGPFMRFAHEFSASDSSEMIMGTIQQMYQGNVDDHNIRALADLANQDMLRQIDDVIKFKIAKFNNLTTRIAMCSMIVIFGWFGVLMVNTFMQVFGTIMQNTEKTYG